MERDEALAPPYAPAKVLSKRTDCSDAVLATLCALDNVSRGNRVIVNTRDEFRQGLRDIVGPSLGISAWALVTGVAMIKSGLSVPLAVLMSLTVYAGSAQFSALPLIAAGAPLWVFWATAFCMNLRFVIFSAHWRKYFGHLPRGSGSRSRISRRI